MKSHKRTKRHRQWTWKNTLSLFTKPTVILFEFVLWLHLKECYKEILALLLT